MRRGDGERERRERLEFGEEGGVDVADADEEVDCTIRRHASHLKGQNKEKVRRRMTRRTWYDLDEVRTPLPDVRAVVDDDHHRLVTRE